MSQKANELNINLHPKQFEALYTKATEVLFGGSAGGGKSHMMRYAAILWCMQIPGLQVYLFRRIREDLIKNHMEGPSGFRSILAGWVECGICDIVDNEIRFRNGSKIYLCHCKDAKDVYKYQGAEIHVLLIDELTHFLGDMYRFLRNRVRMVGITLPPELEGQFPRILCSANPGNVGHSFVKQTFIDDVMPMEIRNMPADEGGMKRQFIPAKLEDNPSMAKDDPGYEARLSGLGSPALVKAMRDGDWNVVDGAYFEEWNHKKHVLRPVELPSYWLRFRSMDWGSASPFSVGWWALVGEDWQHPDGRLIPKGALIRYREWYGAKSPNVGLKLTTEQVAQGIKDREKGDSISYGVLDPSAFAQDGGPSHANRMAALKVYFSKAQNARVSSRGNLGGWDQVRSRLVGFAGKPMVYVFENCKDTIRTLPAIQHDPNRPEDLDTTAEDHALDDFRYGCVSQPYHPPTEDRALQDRYQQVKERWQHRSDDNGWMGA